MWKVYRGRPLRLAASAFFVAIVVVGCRGRDRYENEYGSSKVTTRTDSTVSDTSSDVGLEPVPGTPHNIRPGVTDTGIVSRPSDLKDTTTTPR